MIIQTIPTSDCTPQTIVIGRRATYETLQVVFDLSYLAEAYGSGAAVLVVKRSQDETAYPATITQDGNTLTWTISETDTYYVGAGECELMWYVNNGLAKTIIYPVVVMRDILQTTEEPPDAYENWVESLTALGAETQQHALDAAQSATEAETAQGNAEDAQAAAEAAQDAAEEAATKAEEASAHAPIIVSGYWYAWDTTTEAYQNTGVKAEGRDGTDGFSPVITVTDITGGHRVTITDADGTQTVNVMNGTDGTDGTDGYSPTVTITTITGGHRVTITDETHPTGQSFDVMDGQDGASDAGEVTYDDTETYPDGSVGKEVSQQKNAISQKAPLIINTASGDIASFADGADGGKIRKIVGTIVPQQSGTGDPSPDNVRPISGWTGANIELRGKNLVVPDNPENPMQNYTHTSTGTVLYSSEYDAFYCSGPGIAEDKRGGAYNTLFVAPHDMTVTFSIDTYNVGTNFGIRFYAKGPRVTDIHGTANTWYHYSYTVTLSKGQKLQAVYYDKIYWKNLQVVAGTSADQYYPYVANTLPINWQDEAGTIYGGTVTLNEDGSADVVVERKLIDLGALSWSKYSGKFTSQNIDRFSKSPNAAPVVCDVYQGVVNMQTPSQGQICFNASGAHSYLQVVDSAYTDASAFAASLTGHYAVAQLAAANWTTYHIPNVGSLSTYLGTNNIWIDTGSITECDYPADTKLYVDGLTAPDEDMIADGLIASGKYFTVNNQLYLSTAQIAAGAQIIPGSNCTATSITEALNALNS